MKDKKQKLGLTRWEIFQRLIDNPNDELVHSFYKIIWRNGLKPCEEHVIKENTERVSFKKRTDIIPSLIEFNKKVSIYYPSMPPYECDLRIIPFGNTIIIPTTFNIEDIVMVFRENDIDTLMESFKVATVLDERCAVNKIDIIDDITLNVNGYIITLYNVFPITFETSNDVTHCKGDFICDYSIINI